jgi:hypothetical protein
LQHRRTEADISHQTRAAVAARRVALDGMEHMWEAAVESASKKPPAEVQPSVDLHFDTDLLDFEDDVEVMDLGLSLCLLLPDHD